MVSVERIVSYIDLPPEPPLYSTEMVVTADTNGTMDTMISAKPPCADWPSDGMIEAKNLVCSYRADLDPVIRDISFTIKPGQRVGIVGRTGAGKSSLMSVLLRLIDITGGNLSIDGIDIANIGLHELRPKISVIPQVPFLFLGTIRQNLDMFNQHTDAEIWQALDTLSLREVLMKKVTGVQSNPIGKDLPINSADSSTPNSAQNIDNSGSESNMERTDVSVNVAAVNPLEAEVAENGANYSVGERQLLCLCRAILQRNKILIMDEVGFLQVSCRFILCMCFMQ